MRLEVVISRCFSLADLDNVGDGQIGEADSPGVVSHSVNVSLGHRSQGCGPTIGPFPLALVAVVSLWTGSTPGEIDATALISAQAHAHGLADWKSPR
jgi:hypothetical protein